MNTSLQQWKVSKPAWYVLDRFSHQQWLFIIFGIVTFVWGILMLLVLPDSPTTAKFITEEERLIAMERLRSNKAGYKSNRLNRGQILEAFLDYKTWMLVIYIIGTCIPNGGLTAVRPDPLSLLSS